MAHDEAWHFYEGDPIELLWLDPSLDAVERRTLSTLGSPGEPVAVVPAHHWQAARATQGHALTGCSVAPGFDPADFALMADHSEIVAMLERRYPQLAMLV